MPMTVFTSLKETPDRGIALIAEQLISKGDVIYNDDLTFDRIIKRVDVEKMSPVMQKFMLTYASYNRMSDSYYLCLDNARFFNHSENPNTKYFRDRGLVVALCDILVGEELTANYREFDDYSKEGDFGFEIC